MKLFKATPPKWIDNNGEPSATTAFGIYNIKQRPDGYYNCYYGDGKFREFKSVGSAKEWVETIHYPAQIDKFFEVIGASDTLHRITEWAETAKPAPTLRDINTQFAAHCEEFEELREAVGADATMTAKQLSDKHYTSNDLATGDFDHVAVVDALCDQIFTAWMLGIMLGYDMDKALDRVVTANESKFEDGKAILSPTGKVMKGKDYVAPHLADCIGEWGSW